MALNHLNSNNLELLAFKGLNESKMWEFVGLSGRMRSTDELLKILCGNTKDSLSAGKASRPKGAVSSLGRFALLHASLLHSL